MKSNTWLSQLVLKINKQKHLRVTSCLCFQSQNLLAVLKFRSTLMTSSSGVDGSVELRLRGLHQRPVRGRSEQRHPAAGWGPEGGGGEAVLLQRITQTVPVQPLPAQRHLQGGLEPLRLRLLRDGIPGTLLRERWGWRGTRLTLQLDFWQHRIAIGMNANVTFFFLTMEMSKLANYSNILWNINNMSWSRRQSWWQLCHFGLRTLSNAKGMSDRRQMVRGGESEVLKSEITPSNTDDTLWSPVISGNKVFIHYTFKLGFFFPLKRPFLRD